MPDPVQQPPVATSPHIEPLTQGVSHMRPTLTTIVTRAGGGPVTAEFQVHELNGALAWSVSATETVEAGQPVSLRVPRGVLDAGTEYFATAIGRDPLRFGVESPPSPSFVPRYGLEVGDDMDPTIDPVDDDDRTDDIGPPSVGTREHRADLTIPKGMDPAEGFFAYVDDRGEWVQG